MRHLDEILSGRVSLVDVDRRCRSRSRSATPIVVIGAVLIPGAKAPKLITRQMLGEMKTGSVIVRRRDRPGRLRRDVEADHAHRSRLRRRRRHPLLRREHARRRPDHVDEGADERDAPVRRGDRDPWADRRRSRPTRLSLPASTCSRARSRTRPSPRRTALRTRRWSRCWPRKTARRPTRPWSARGARRAHVTPAARLITQDDVEGEADELEDRVHALP